MIARHTFWRCAIIFLIVFWSIVGFGVSKAFAAGIA
jgi:hypothetical protein